MECPDHWCGCLRARQTRRSSLRGRRLPDWGRSAEEHRRTGHDGQHGGALEPRGDAGCCCDRCDQRFGLSGRPIHGCRGFKPHLCGGGRSIDRKRDRLEPRCGQGGPGARRGWRRRVCRRRVHDNRDETAQILGRTRFVDGHRHGLEPQPQRPGADAGGERYDGLCRREFHDHQRGEPDRLCRRQKEQRRDPTAGSPTRGLDREPGAQPPPDRQYPLCRGQFLEGPGLRPSSGHGGRLGDGPGGPQHPVGQRVLRHIRTGGRVGDRRHADGHPLRRRVLVHGRTGTPQSRCSVGGDRSGVALDCGRVRCRLRPGLGRELRLCRRGLHQPEWRTSLRARSP